MDWEGKITDLQIKSLLTSTSRADHEKGLILLDKKYRRSISGIIRSWSNTNGIFVSAENLRSIWYDTLRSVAENVCRGKFKEKGSLKAYLSRIARCRAIDDYRKRFLIAAEPATKSARGPSQMAELLEEIEACCKRLSIKLAVVLRADVKLFLQKSGWVSLAELTAEVNKTDREELKESTVRARRARARAQLRSLLGE